MAERDIVGAAPYQFEARDRGPEALAGPSQKRERILEALETDERGRPGARIWKEAERSGGDDAERSFGADEQALQVVAGVVLAQLAQGVDDAPVGENGFDAGDEVARIAIGDDGDAARIGRNVAADGAGSF